MASFWDYISARGLSGAGAPFGVQSPQEDAQNPPGPLDKLVRGMGAAAWNGFTAPGNALNSTPDNPVMISQMIAPAVNLANMVTLGAGAAPAEAGALRAGIGRPGIYPAFHGTGTAFDNFSLGAPKTTGGGLNDMGIFGTPDPRVASRYAEFGGDAPNVKMISMNMQKPLQMTAGEFERLQDIANMVRNGKSIPEVKGIFLQSDLEDAGIKWDGASHPIDAIKKAGFDGIIKQSGRGGAEPEYMVFDPRQISGRNK